MGQGEDPQHLGGVDRCLQGLPHLPAQKAHQRSLLGTGL